MSLSSLHLYGCRDQFKVSLIAQLVEHCTCIAKVTNKIMPAKYFVGILFELKRCSVFGYSFLYAFTVKSASQSNSLIKITKGALLLKVKKKRLVQALRKLPSS